MPAGVPAATLTLPVAVSNVRPAGTAPGATDKTAFDGLAATPFTVSAVKAFTTAVAPDAPFTPVALSLVATMTANTVLVSSAVLLTGSRSVYPDGTATEAELVVPQQVPEMAL